MKFSLPQLDSIKSMQAYQMLRQTGLILVAVCMTKGLLSNDEIGNWELLTFLGFSTTFFWLDGLLKTYVAESEGNITSENQLFQIYGIVMAIMMAIGVILFIGKDSFVPQVLGLDQINFLPLFIGYLIFNVPISILPAYYLLKNRNTSLFILGVLLLLGPPLCVLLTTGFGYDISKMYWAFFVFSVVLHFVLWFELIQLHHWKWSMLRARQIVCIAWPLMLYAIAVSMAKVFDGWLVSWYYRDEATFAIFRYGAREFPLAVALSAGMTMAFIPLLQKNRAEALEIIKQRSTIIMHILFPIVCVLLLISPFVFKWVFNPDFELSALIFNVYLLLITSQVLFPHAILLAEKKNKMILIVSLAELIINMTLSIILIKYWGLQGVAIATVIAYLLEKVLFVLYIQEVFGINLSRYINTKIYFGYFVLTGFIFLITLFL